MRKVPCRASERGVSGVRAFGGLGENTTAVLSPPAHCSLSRQPRRRTQWVCPVQSRGAGTGGVPGARRAGERAQQALPSRPCVRCARGSGPQANRPGLSHSRPHSREASAPRGCRLNPGDKRAWSSRHGLVHSTTYVTRKPHSWFL